MKYFFHITFFCLSTFILLGVSTFFFKGAQGYIRYFEETAQINTGISEVPKQGGTKGGAWYRETVDVSYRYKVDGTEYRNDVYGYYVFDSPSRIYVENQTVTVYHLPFLPSVSVLHRGFDRWLFLVWFIMLTLYFFWKEKRRKWLAKMKSLKR